MPRSDEVSPSWIMSEYSNLFDDSLVSKLPSHRPQDCSIDLISDSIPPLSKVYHLTVEEDTVMKEWLTDKLAKGFIQKSASPFGAPCFFVKKKSGDLRLCMDYRALNLVTKKDRNPLPLISDLLRHLSKGHIFTALNLRGAYNLLRVRQGASRRQLF